MYFPCHLVTYHSKLYLCIPQKESMESDNNRVIDESRQGEVLLMEKSPGFGKSSIWRVMDVP